MSHHTARIAFEPWVPVFIALMVRLSQSDRFKATLSTFVLEHGVRIAS